MENKDMPAFPITEEATDRIVAGVEIYSGFSKRELAILIIASGKVSQQPPGRYKQSDADAVALDAIMITDALLAELSKPQP